VAHSTVLEILHQYTINYSPKTSAIEEGISDHFRIQQEAMSFTSSEQLHHLSN